MANRKMKRHSRHPAWAKHALVVACACLSTLLGAPVSAATSDVAFPAVPLQSGTPYPAPNIMFILDDSGSMTYAAMPKDISSFSGLDDDIWDKSYVHNTLYYNPYTEYQPWKKADNSRYTGGTDYSNAYSDSDLVGGSTTNLGSSTQTFFVPKANATDLDDEDQYDKYQIRYEDGSLRVVMTGAEVRESWDNRDIDDREWWYGSIEVPAGATSLIVQMSGTDEDSCGRRCTRPNGDADLYLRNGSKPTTSSYDHADTDSGNNDTITVDNPASGTWWIGVYNSNRDYTADNIDIDAVATDRQFKTPTGRSEADEMTNFATWYSYHRTRMKVAKFAASEAFSQLGDNYRVGYDSIWNRKQGVSSNDSSAPTSGPAYPIPTGVDEGLFKGANRTKWFEFLHKAEGNNGTPLHDALWRAGEYYESSAPWKSGTAAADISCRLSFSILTTDGYWNSRSQTDWRGNYDSSKYGANADGSDGSRIDRPAGAVGGSYTYKAKRPYKDDRAGTLGDVAMHFWKRDLRSTLDNNVPTSSADEAFWQHMVTFGVAIGLAGELDPEDDLVDLTSGAKEWPDPRLSEMSGSASYASRIDDLYHATVNSRGAFVSASDPARFVNGLLSALTTISERPGSASNVTANSTSFTSDTRVYQASYTSGTWTGELTAYVATSAGIQGAPAWKASQGIPTDYTKRKIWTWDKGGGEGAAFPTAAQKTALDVSSRSGSAATADENAAYIKGDRSNEPSKDGKLRARSSLLGDIVNSSPIYVTDSGALFVGANDGMLHAFDGSTGKELFAYVPGGINLTNLASLSDPQYGQTVTHKYFVDGPITVSAKSQTPGKNYLVGALGRGGRGVFALDVTTPSSFDEDDVLWESSSDSDMGMVLGDPLVVTLNDADRTKAVVVSNGVNSPDGSATLFVLKLSDGSVIKEIEAGTGGGNGLFAPRGWDDNGDGAVDYIYAGDLQGNLWKFDLSADKSSDWEVANSGDPMYKARDADGNVQPITAGLALARNPDNSDLWVFFGTGRFMSVDDLTSTSVQTLYGIKDGGSAVKGRTSDTEFGDLVKREIVAVSDDKRVRAFDEWKRTLEDGKKGWFLDLDDPYKGERVVSGLRVLGTTLIASSIVPGTGSSACDAGGTGYINALDAFTGTSPSQAFFDVNKDGVVNDADKIKTTIDGKEVYLPAGSLDLGIGMPTRATIIDKLLVVGGSGGGLGTVTIDPPTLGARRVSWREILRD
ncbi:PilC/PilY family type IV pilus protein [Luteimonas sp. 8-5]|uniref:PilC/PilY family type IV pilus protein n=1 Tax=Luteimonas sp. 8-5 TaxID=3039387 RepID=UPI0024370E59|nr:PilC/PilY family type IV pilus protein [Luteimonas sp. 8-5]MDG6347424.1 PilC/PilY family type IV pilus protein [Luteimonas sp. 8-5]